MNRVERNSKHDWVIRKGDSAEADAITLKGYKRRATQIARDFRYSESVIREIKAAKTQEAVSAIMQRARISMKRGG